MCKKFGTDKGPAFMDINYYDYWFRRYINPSILEIGVLNGCIIHFNGECDVCIDIEDNYNG